MYYSSFYNYCIGAIKQVSSETETSRRKIGGKYIYMYYSSFYNYCIGAIKQVSSETETSRRKRGGKYLLLFTLDSTKQVRST